jgi:RimJ/RimL family protein N-acetyltransferase
LPRSEAPIGTATITFRPPSERDYERMLGWRRDPETIRLLMCREVAKGIEDVAAWIERRTGDPNGVFRVITPRDGDEPIGFVQLVRMDRVNRHCQMGLFLEKSVRGSGAAAEAMAAMEAEAAGRFGMRKVVAEVLGSNERSIRLVKGQGYRQVGTLARHYHHDGVYHDVELFEKMIAP